MDIMATYTVEAFMASYAWGSWKILAISALTFFFGYMEYVYSFRLVAREKSAPYPMWMHTFYFAHDFTGVVVFGALALKYHFWFFYFAALALVIWNGFEIYNMYKGIELERQEIWGAYYEASPYFDQPWYYLMGLVCVGFATRNLLIVKSKPTKPQLPGEKPPIW